MKNKFELYLRVFIGVVFLFSAYTKFISPGLTEIILVDHGIAATRDIAAILARFLIGFEFAIGLLFFQPYFLKKIVIPISSLFLLAFTIYLFYTGFILNDSENCGCFGEVIKMSPVESIIKNIILFGLLFVLYKHTSEEKKYFVAPVIIILAIALTFVVSPIKSQRDFKFSKYTYFEQKGRVDLSNGDKLIAVLNTECDHCQTLAKDLFKLKRNSKKFPELYTLFFTEGTVSIDSFKTLTGFDFPYKIISADEFFNLIGQSPPRIYWLKNGVVKEMWDNNFINKIISNF